jgi:GT2 family glycosyltransferase
MKISVILLNWNGSKYIFDCIKSVINQTYKNIEVILVDNNSTDGSIEKIQNKYPYFKYILNSDNLGYAEGMNVGIRIAKGDYIMLLGYDVYLSTDYIEKAIERIKKDKKIGIIAGPEFAWVKGRKTNKHLPSSGAYYLKKRIQVGIYKDRNKERYAFGVTGSFPLIRKKLLDDLYNVSGYYFDKDFETGWEDTDLRFRALFRGWKTLYYPKIKAWHVGSASDNENFRLIEKSLDYQKRIFRNRLYVIEKNFPKEIKKWLKPYIWITDILMYFYYTVISGKSIKAINLAKKEFKENLQDVRKKRTNIVNNILITIEEIKKQFIKF